MFHESTFPRWFVFGETADGLRCDVSDGERDVVTLVTKAEAEALIADRNFILDVLIEIVGSDVMKFYDARDAVMRRSTRNIK
jgi:hypothetical protein